MPCESRHYNQPEGIRTVSPLPHHPMKNNKNRITRLKYFGLILACLVDFPSCSGIQAMVDTNKLNQLEADYKAGKVSRKYYKSEKGRLELEIRENQKMMAEFMAHPIGSTVDENGNPVVGDGNGNQVADDGSGQVADDGGVDDDTGDPVFVCDNIYYYQYHGHYFYSLNGQRHFVSRLPANGRRVVQGGTYPRPDQRIHSGQRPSGTLPRSVPASPKVQQAPGQSGGSKSRN